MSRMPAKRTLDERRSQMYVLRLWREAAGAPWRLSLRTATGGEASGFADLDDLVVFLLRAMSGEREATTDADADERT